MSNGFRRDYALIENIGGAPSIVGTKIFGLFTARNNELARQNANAISGHGISKSVTQATPIIRTHMRNAVRSPANRGPIWTLRFGPRSIWGAAASGKQQTADQ